MVKTQGCRIILLKSPLKRFQRKVCPSSLSLLGRLGNSSTNSTEGAHRTKNWSALKVSQIPAYIFGNKLRGINPYSQMPQFSAWIKIVFIAGKNKKRYEIPNSESQTFLFHCWDLLWTVCFFLTFFGNQNVAEKAYLRFIVHHIQETFRTEAATTIWRQKYTLVLCLNNILSSSETLESHFFHFEAIAKAVVYLSVCVGRH